MPRLHTCKLVNCGNSEEKYSIWMLINKNQQPSCVGCPIPTILKYLTAKMKWEEHIHLFFFLHLLDSWVDMDHNIILVCLKYTKSFCKWHRISSALPLYHFLHSPPCLCTHTHSVIFKKHNQNRTWKLRTQCLSVETVHTKAACSYIFPRFPPTFPALSMGLTKFGEPG